MSLSEGRHTLRKLEFPFCARESLSRIEQVCSSAQGMAPNSRQSEQAKDLIVEFVFCEADRRSKKKKLTCVQEIQLLEVLCDYLSCPGGNEAARYAVFLLLFPASQPGRTRLLLKLVSMAINTNNAPVLMATTMLMRQLSCSSDFSLQLAGHLVKDNFELVPKLAGRLKVLPEIAPLFVASFLTAVTKIYGRVNKDDKESPVWRPPPSGLLNVVTQWLTDHSDLCLAPLIAQLPLNLPSADKAAIPTTPYVGLFRWSIFAPIYENDMETRSMYNALHFALLDSLTKCIPARSKRPPYIVLCEHLDELITDVRKSFSYNVDYLIHTVSNLGHAIQMIMHTKSFHGDDLVIMKNLEELAPYNRLIKMILIVYFRNRQKAGAQLHESAINLINEADDSTD